MPDPMLGLLAECCYVSLQQIVTGRITQCAFRDIEHECQHDVFSDVFSMWTTGQLSPQEPPMSLEDEDDPESEPQPPARRLPKEFASGRPPEYWWSKKQLRGMSTKKLRKLALSGYWTDREIKAMKRGKLIKLLSTPHWKNEHDDANMTVFLELRRRSVPAGRSHE